MISSAVCLATLSNEVKVTGKKAVIAQANDPILNGTDYNYTFGQFSPNIDITIPSRVIIEYGDMAITQDIASGLPTFQIPPRTTTEYADYAVFMAPSQSYPGPDPVAISISSPVENPPNGLLININKTVSFNVTSPLSPIENVTLFYKTTLNQTWIPLNYTWAGNVTSTAAQVTILGQTQPCNVTYKIEAYNYRGDYAMNDNASKYYVYNVTVPEFPSVLILPLFMIATLVAAIFFKKQSQSADKNKHPYYDQA
jgi:hypothetical protein